MGSNQYWAGRVYGLCLYFMTGAPARSTESGFMGKPESNIRPLVYKAVGYPCQLFSTTDFSSGVR